MFDDKTILITGGTGSFGKQCVADILARYRPKRLIILSRDEYKQYLMQQQFNAPCMRYFLGDVRDAERMDRAVTGVDYIIHAAALKQVPALEYNPGEAVKTNIGGAENVIAAALKHRVGKVIALSTDKAVSPHNLYGATKLVSDKLFVAANNIRGDAKTQFSVVRYGNVLGSRGSVIPLFKQLIAQGATSLPITDPGMTRFSITLPQAVATVFSAFSRMLGGEIFVPKIPSVDIMTVVRAMAPQLQTHIIGIRPGEKIHELMCPIESATDTLEFADHYIIKPSFSFAQPQQFECNALGEPGRPVSSSFEYRSDTNPIFLSAEQLQPMLAQW